MDSDDEKYYENFGNPVGVTGFLDVEDVDSGSAYNPSSASTASSATPAFSSPPPPSSAAAYMTLICKHGLKRNSCSECFKEYNEKRKSFGYDESVAWGIFCKHGRNKFLNKRYAKKDPSGLGPCGDPECITTKPYEYQTKRIEHLGNPQEQGEVSSASLGLPSLKPLNLFGIRGDEGMEKKGGKIKYKRRMSFKKNKRSSRKYRKSSRKNLKGHQESK